MDGDIIISGEYAYLSTGDELYIYNISDPENPIKIGSFFVKSNVRTMAMSGDYAILSYATGISVIDISDPEDPVKVSELHHEGIYSAAGSQIIGDYLYRFCYDDLIIVDISDPYNPFEVSRYDYPPLFLDHFHTSYLDENHLFISWCRSHKIAVIDISDPYNPFEAGVVEHPDAGRGLFARDDHLYFDYGGNFTIYNISDLSNPVEIGKCESSGHARGLYVSGNFAYKTSITGFHVFDISDPSNPHEISHIDIEYCSYSLVVKGNYAYMSGTGIKVIDISNPAEPVQVGYYYNGISFGALDVSGDLVFTEDYGLTILRFDPGMQFDDKTDDTISDYVLYDNFPNPFNPETYIRFRISEQSNVSLKIYNITGQHVKTLYTGNLEPRYYRFKWNGTNNRGQRVGSGVYIYRLQAGNFTQTKKMLLIK